jgi:hypothetical protein
MKPPRPLKPLWLTGPGAGLALLATALGGSFEADFNDNLVPAGAMLYGDTGEGNAGVVEEGVLKLTKAVGSQQAGFVIDDLDGGETVSGFTATFKLLVGGGTAADGCSFNFAPDLPDSTFGEEGTGTGLSICFDVYNNGDGEAPAIDLKYAGTIVASAKGATTLALFRQNAFVDVSVTVNTDSTLSLAVDHTVVFTNFYGAFTATPGRFGFGARTGGSADNHWVDDIRIVTSTAPPVEPAHPLVVVNSPSGGDVSPEPVIHVEIKDFTTQADVNSVRLLLNDVEVAATIAKTDDLTMVDFDPAGLLPPLSANTYTVIYTDNGTPPFTSTQVFSFTVVGYNNVVLPTALYLETFEGAEEGSLPTGWVQTNATYSLNPGYLDLGDPSSDSYLGWTVIERSRLEGSPFNARRLNVASGYLNGEPITSLVDSKSVYAESDNRGSSQIQMLFSPDFDLTGKTDVYVSYNGYYEQNQDSMGSVEYSIDGGATWLPIVYMLDGPDIFKDANGNIDALTTFSNVAACCGDQPWYMDPSGSGEGLWGGNFGAFIGVTEDKWGTLSPYISARVNDDPVESKRVELFRLAPADNQARVRFRFAQAGTGSWYFGIDNFGLYSIPTPSQVDFAIGLNFGADEAAGANTGTLAAADKAGVPGLAQANWNNLSLLSGTSTAIVADDNGTAEPTTVTVVWNSANTWSSTGRGEENNGLSGVDKVLMTGYLDTGAATTSTVQIASLPARLTEAGYDVYVYALGGVGGRGGSYRILDGATGKVLRDSIRAQSPTNLASYAEVPSNLGATANGAANLVFGAGNYLVFRGLTAPAITVEARTAAAGTGVGYSATPRAPINAIQLVTPSSGSLLDDVTMPGDWIVSSNDDSRSPAAERVPNAIDNNLLTKYLNFGNDTDQAAPFVGPVGFTVTPSGGASIVSGLALTSANDAPERDPAAYRLEGSNDGLAFTLISEGPVGAFPARFVRQAITFPNTTPYTTYRLSVPDVANNATANSMQVAEVELLGRIVAPKFTTMTRNADGSVTVTWKGGGTLQAATAVTGPWEDVVGATSPYTFSPAITGPALFGRIKQ